jgi:sugar phosphate permease
MTGAAPARSYRWTILAVAFLVLLTSFSIRLALSNVTTILGQDLALTATAIGAFVTAFYVGYVAANAVGGVAADRIGARRAIWLAMASLSVFTFGFGWVTNAVTGLAVQAAMGLSAGVYFSATTKLVGAWFPARERGRAFGIISMPSSMAVIIANSVYPLIVAAYSWQTLYHVLGIYVAVVTLLCFFLLRDAPQVAETASAPPAQPTGAAIREILGNRDFVLLAIGGFCGSWGTWGFAFWANALLVKGHGLSGIEAGQITAIFGIGALVAKPLYGWLSDLLPLPRKYMVVACYAAFAAMLMVFGLLDTGWLRIAAPILGVTAFVYSPIMSALLTEMIGKRSVGTAAGLMNAFWQTGVVIVPLVVGGVFQATGSFIAAFVVLAAGPAIGSICMLLVRENREVD